MSQQRGFKRARKVLKRRQKIQRTVAKNDFKKLLHGLAQTEAAIESEHKHDENCKH